MGYTIIFGEQERNISDEAGHAVEAAIAAESPLVTIAIDLAGDGGESHQVTLVTRRIVALIRDRGQYDDGEPRPD